MGHVLVTGATGYVGRRLVARLNGAGVPVRALTRKAVSLPEGVGSEIGDLTDRAALDRACAGVSAVVNLAAITADRKPPPGGYDRVNATGVANLATVADVTTCLERQVACQADQLLENETPRIDELLGLGGVSLP